MLKLVASMPRKQGTFIFFALSLIAALILPACFQHGMFMDGIQYAIVSENLASGKGSFWFPYLSASWNKLGETAFLEHPPLSYFLQALFFKAFGNGFYVEKLYGLFMAILCIYSIFRIWVLVFDEQPVYKKYWWLAAALWFITPSVCWSFKNNMIENTLSVFVLASCLFCLKALLNEKRVLLNLLLSGLFVFAGSLTKGIPALFPVAMVICYYLCTKKITLTKTTLYTLCIIAVAVAGYLVIILMSGEAKDSLSFYLKRRLLERMESGHTVDNRFSIVWWLITDEFVDLGFVLVLILIFKWQNFRNKLGAANRQIMWFFFVFGLCGVAPLCLTYVQRAVYFVPAIPFISMGLAVLLAGHLEERISKMSLKADRAFRSFVVVGALVISFLTILGAGSDARDEVILSDVRKINAALGDNNLIGTDDNTYLDWDFQFYLLRYGYNTLIGDKENKQRFSVHKKNEHNEVPHGFEEMNIDLENYKIYRRLN